jgi:hypothetical protein
MAKKEIKISVPEGYEIDKEHSTFECIKFKKKSLTYGDIEDKIIAQRGRGGITAGWFASETSCTTFGVHTVGSKPNLEQLLALNKLMNVAEHLNEKKFNWDDRHQPKWYIYYDHSVDVFRLGCNSHIQSSNVHFDSEEHAEQAIEILGDDTIKKALGVFE